MVYILSLFSVAPLACAESFTDNSTTVPDLNQSEEKESFDQTAFLDTGIVINSKMKSLASGDSETYEYYNSSIKAIRKADSLPADFVPSESNTISADTSPVPVYNHPLPNIIPIVPGSFNLKNK